MRTRLRLTRAPDRRRRRGDRVDERAALLRRRSDRARAGEPQRGGRQAAQHRAVLRVRLQPVRDRRPSAVQHPRRQLNTIDEVPDSSWFTNRIGAAPMTADQIARGVNSDTPPAPEKWVLLREKSAGTNPGFTARDANGETWFLQFDSPDVSGGQHRGRGDRDQAVLGARLQPGRDLHHALRSGARADRSEGHDQAAVRRENAVHARRHHPRARAGGAQRGRHLPGLGRPPASRNDPRAVPLRGHPLRRPERPRAARASPRAARAPRLRRLDQPGRLEGRQHARHPGRGGRPNRS